LKTIEVFLIKKVNKCISGKPKIMKSLKKDEGGKML